MAGSTSEVHPGPFPAAVCGQRHPYGRGLGRIVKALDESGQFDNTLVFFTSDNGGQQDYASSTEYGGKYGPYPTLGDNRPLRGWKGDLYEGGIRVPAFLYWCGRLRPVVIQERVSLLDWFPTFASLAGAEVAEQWKIEGRNVWPILAGETPALAPPVFYWKTDAKQGLLKDDWKLIVPVSEVSTAELYNLAAEYPGRVESMRRILADRVSRSVQKEIQSKP